MNSELDEPMQEPNLQQESNSTAIEGTTTTAASTMEMNRSNSQDAVGQSSTQDFINNVPPPQQ